MSNLNKGINASIKVLRMDTPKLYSKDDVRFLDIEFEVTVYEGTPDEETLTQVGVLNPKRIKEVIEGKEVYKMTDGYSSFIHKLAQAGKDGTNIDVTLVEGNDPSKPLTFVNPYRAPKVTNWDSILEETKGIVKDLAKKAKEKALTPIQKLLDRLNK